MKKRRLLILIGLLIVVSMILCLVACSGNNASSGESEDEEPTAPTIKTLTGSQSLDKIYNGLIAGGEYLASAKNYGVETIYTAYTRPSSGGTGLLNYTLTYKANYNENYADSEIYIYVFDNNAHVERLVVYYDGADLYVVSGEGKYVVSGFSTTMMFNVFYEACRELDMTTYFFGDEIGSIFNRNSAVNLSLIVNTNNTKYRYAGDGNEVVEYNGLDVTILNENVNNAMNNYFRGVGDKFDLISKKFFGFSVNRLAEARINTISGDLIQTRITNDVANREVWEVSGRLQDTSFYKVQADVGYNDGKSAFAEKSNFVKSTFKEASLGQNRLLGTVLLPAFSDAEYDAEIVTNVSSSDNGANEMSLRFSDAVGTDFLSAYFRDGRAYVDATGVDEWLDGAIDLAALHLPKVYFPDINLSRMIGAGYNNVVKAMLNAVKKDVDGTVGREDLYDAVMENFHNDGKSYVYYIFTEEWYHKISGDEEPVMDKVARAVNIERAQLAAFLGEEFFLEMELELGYDLESGVITVKVRKAGAEIVRMTLVREGYRGVTFPSDVYDGTPTYARLVLPDEITMEFEVSFAVRNGQTSTDLSPLLGTLIGDASGINTPNILKNTEVLLAEGTVTETFFTDSQGNTVTDNIVNVSLYIRKNATGEKTLVASVRTNPNDRTELLVSYYLAVGTDLTAEENAGGLFYRIKKSVVSDSFGDLLGDDNIMSESNVLTIVDRVVNAEGISQVSKMNGYFNFSLVVSDRQDPVKELIGLENTTATAKIRVDFLGVDNEVDMSRFVVPAVTPFENVFIETVYDSASAWKDRVEVIINGTVFHCCPNYDPESIAVVTGKTLYTPTAKLFGQEISYRVVVNSEVGTYRVSRLYDPIIIIDPTYSTKLPDKVEVVYDNGVRGYLPCVIEGFAESNVTLAGYNLAGFANEFDDSMKSRVVIGVDSIMNVSFDAYILVQNRKVIPKVENGLALTDGNGVPVVETLFIDPYTYAMRLRDDPSYDPIVDGLRRAGAELKFENVYGQEEVPDGEEMIVRDLTYDVVGYNRFRLFDLGLDWEYNGVISYRGSDGYAYATFGSAEGEAIRIAVRIAVVAQRVDHVSIDDEDNDVYTIDFLQRASYNVPTQTSAQHTVKVFFKGADDAVELKSRYVSLARPDGLSDDEYHDNYLATTLNWDGVAQEVVQNPYVITDRGERKEQVSATFGSTLGVGEQTVRLTVEIPSRVLNDADATPRYVATSCAIDGEGNPVFTKNNVTPTKAYFPETDGVTYQFYDYLLVNPYDASFRMPSSVYIEVPKVSGYHATKVVKRYDVEWVTTDSAGNELDLLEEKTGGGLGLKHPVTDETDLVVYGKVGDRGDEPANANNKGYVWIAMIVRNERSVLRSISYAGLEDGQDTIENVDPYGEYTLPYSFVAVLESGKTIERYGVEWEVRVGEEGEYRWYPATYDPSSGAPSSYYKDGKFVFDRRGGMTAIRYVIEGDSDSIRQTLTLNVEVLSRTLLSDRVDVYARSGDQPKQGYENIDIYEAPSTELYDRLTEIADGNNVSGVAFAETGSAGVYEPKYLAVDWTRASVGESEYIHSLDYLLRLLTSADAVQELLNEVVDGSMTMTGTIYTGTVNEQRLEVRFSFADRKISEIGLTRLAYAQENDAARVGTIDEGSASPVVFDNDNDRRENRQVVFASLGSPLTLNIRLDKPFALTRPDALGRERYASPTDYFAYLFGSVQISFTGSAPEKQVTPVLSYQGTTAAFDRATLEPDGIFGMTSFTLRKLSAGSAIDVVYVNVYSLQDERLDESATITPELYDETGAEIYSDVRPYRLPDHIDVAYRNSGLVRYDVDAWTVEGAAAALFDGVTTAEIPAKLINVIRSVDADTQANLYNFAYDLPCVAATYHVTVYIPKKDVRRVAYRATGETSLYDVTDGVLTIDNPYLYYDPDVEYMGKKYGFDVSKIPTKIYPIANGFDFWATEVAGYNVSWTFKENVFTSDLFATGSENLLIAEATLGAYYDENYVKQSQKIELYIKLNALSFDGIAHDDMTVVTLDGEGVENVIEIDPYNDVNGYAGRFYMPNNGLTVTFGAESYVFNDVRFFLRSTTGAQYPTAVTMIEYDERGHKFSSEDYPDLRQDGVLEFNMYLPGFGIGRLADGTEVYDESRALRVYVRILSKVIETAFIPNRTYDSAGLRTGSIDLPGLYYIDPYNADTYALPSVVNAKFFGVDEIEEIKISGWEYFDEESGEWTDFSTDRRASFYRRASAGDSAVYYGFFNPGSEGYRGGIYENVRGYISMGRSVTGEVTKQTFGVAVIVLNRSLKSVYTTSYRYDDPFGGVLSDVGGTLDEDMFVAYEKYYEEFFAEKGIAEEYRYDNFAAPVVPAINWAVYNEESVVEPLGGFDKEIVGNAFYGDTHRANGFLTVSEKWENRYEELARSIVWDAYFTESGYPLAYYSANTTANLNALAAELKSRVILRTYERLVEALSASSDETEKQYANYLTNGLVNEIVSEYNYSKDADMQKIVGVMYSNLKNEYESSSTERAAIYPLWKAVYDAFLAEGTDTDPDLSEYQAMKAAFYALANDPSDPKFTEQEKTAINAPLRKTVENKLKWYRNAAVFDEMYDLATAPERELMDRLRDTSDTDRVVSGVELSVIRRAVALEAYYQSTVYTIGSIGESVYARITAPKLTLGDLYDLTVQNPDGSYPILNEFVFNLYNEEPFMSEVGVGFTTNYDNVYRDSIAEAIRLAIEDYRALPAAQSYSVTEFVKSRVAEFVNGIVPIVDVENSGGETEPLIDFTYAEYSANDGANASYWTDLYEYRSQQAERYLATYDGAEYGSYEERWRAARRVHVLNEETGIVEEMDAIYDQAAHDPENIAGEGVYQAAFGKYKDLIRSHYLSDMQPHLDDALLRANAEMTDYIYNGQNFNYLLSRYNSYDYLFSLTFGETMNEAYDVLYASFAYDNGLRARLNSELVNNEGNKGVTMRQVMRSSTLDTAIVARAGYVYLWKLGSAAAWDVLYENGDSVGYPKETLRALYEAARTRTGGYLRSDRYNVGEEGAFTEEAFDSFCKTVLVERIIAATTRAEYKARITSWRDDAVRANKSAAFENLLGELSSDEEIAAQVLATRDDVGRVKARAFVSYVEAKVALGQAYGTAIEERKRSILDRAVFDGAQEAVDVLLSNESTFEYKGYLIADGAEATELKSLALDYYLERFATAWEKVIIGSQRAFSGSDEGAYDALLSRAELDTSIKDALRNAYATVLLEAAFAKVKAAVENDVTERINNGSITDDATYNAISGKNTGLVQSISATGNVLDVEQSGQVRNANVAEYVSTVYAQKIASYTTFVAGKEAAASDAATEAGYGLFYEGYSETFDAILENYYDGLSASNKLKKYHAFDYLTDVLTDAKTEWYRTAKEEVADVKAKAELYDDLGRYAMASAASAIEDLIAGYEGVYNALSDEERASIDLVAGLDGLFNIADRAEFLAAFIDRVTTLSNMDAGDAQETVDTFLAGISAFSETFLAGYETETDRVFNAAVTNAVREKGYVDGSYDARLYAVRGAVAIGSILCAAVRFAEEIDRDYLTQENLSGDYTVTGEDFRAEYVAGLEKALKNAGYDTARLYLDTVVAKNKTALLTDDERTERVNAEVLLRLLLTAEGEDIRSRFAAQLRAYDAARSDAEDYLARAAFYDELGALRVKNAESETVWSGLKESYDHLPTADKNVVDGYFDSSVFEATYADLSDGFTAFLTAYNALVSVDAGGDSASVNLLLDRFETAANTAIGDLSDVDAAHSLVEAIRSDVNASYRAANRYLAKAEAVRLAATLGRMTARMEELRGQMPASYLSDENRAGDYSTTSDDHDASFVANVLSYLAANKFSSGLAVVERGVENCRDAIDGDAESSTRREELVRAKLSLTYSSATVTKMMANFGAGERELIDLLKSGCAIVDVNAYLTAKRTLVLSELDPYLASAGGGNTDADYQAVFDAMLADGEEKVVTFGTAAYTSDEDFGLGTEYFAPVVGRYGVIFDATGLTLSNDNTAIGNLRILNTYKMNDEDCVFVRNGLTFTYRSIAPAYVDYYGSSYIGTDAEGNYVVKYHEGRTELVNTLVIDPLTPELPSSVRAYGKYTTTDGRERLYDLGTPAVEYSALFYENVYTGQAQNDTDYVVTLLDSRGNRYDHTVSVTYLDATIEKISVADGRHYGGAEDGENENYYTLYDAETGKNRIVIDPIDEDIIDAENKKYVLPSELLVTYANLTNADGTKKQALLTNVTWDDSAVKYSLSGESGIKLRPTGYRVIIDETEYTVRFSYSGAGTLSFAGNGTSGTMQNAPDYSVFNIVLDRLDQTVTALSIRDAYGEANAFGSYDEEGDFIDVPASAHTVNPFDIRYPGELVLSFAGSSPKDYVISDWTLEPGTNGTFKIMDMIQNKQTDGLAIARFTYLGYTVRVRFVVDDIRIDAIETDPNGERIYMDGGTIYLVMGGGSAESQLKENYSYLYYNFGTGGRSDYRKVALSFTDLATNDISTESVRRYERVLGVLGWDKENYPNLGLSNNISFTVEVVHPLMVASLNGDYNRFVRADYVSLPFDNNFQKASYSSLPQGTSYGAVVHVSGEERIVFAIDEDATVYDVLGNTATFRCVFDLNGTNFKIAADESGNRAKSFAFVLPLDAYLYTVAGEARFDKTPVKDGDNDVWTWAGDAYSDAIVWPLGRELKTSDLPRLLYEDDGSTYSIRPLWDLTDLNVNRATEDGYVVTAYYYDKNGVWRGLPLVVYVNKIDVTEDILYVVGGSYAINVVYNAHYYKLPLYLDDPFMLFLREDGSKMALDESAVDIRYKKESDPDREYSRTNYPIDVGRYDIKVVVTDYNVRVQEELVFHLTIEPVHVTVSEIEFENRVNNLVEYVFDGQPKPLTVVSGLPTVTPDNWFASQEEKQQLLNAQYLIDPSYTVTEAKSAAYLELFGRVPRGAKAALSDLSNRMRLLTGAKGEELNAVVFDSLTADYSYVEVVSTVYYTQGDSVIGSIPTDVGSYTAVFTLDEEANFGNYVLSSGATRVAVAMSIVKPNLTYSVVSDSITYTGRAQNPLISGLHDEEGRLPAGVTVTYGYRYSVNGETKYLSSKDNGGVTDVGTYLCDIVVDGGNNYPSETLNTLTITVVPKDLFIRLENAGSDYLDAVANLREYLRFDGLVGADGENSFGFADVTSEVKSYYTIGEYEYSLEGFRIDSTYEVNYTFVEEETEIDGVTYKKFSLRPVAYEGSLYAYRNADGSYSFATMIALFTNYNVYVEKTGRYVVSVEGGTGASIRTTDADDGSAFRAAIASVSDGERLEIRAGYTLNYDLVEEAYERMNVSGRATIVLYRYNDEEKSGFAYLGSVRSENGQKVKVYEVEDDEALASAVLGARYGARVEIYLKAAREGDAVVEKTYSTLVIDVPGSVVVYGCYDENREVVTYLDGVVVKDGALDLRIIGFRTKANGAVLVDVLENADDVRISNDCRFFSYHTERIGEEDKVVVDKNTVGVRTDNNYTGNLTVNGCSFVGFRRAIELMNGGLRIEETGFVDNYVALTIESVGSDVNVLSNEFAGNDVGIVVKNGTANIRFNTLVRNRFGIVVDDSVANMPDLTEDILVIRNNTESGEYVFDDTNVVKVVTSSAWAEAQQS